MNDTLSAPVTQSGTHEKAVVVSVCLISSVAGLARSHQEISGTVVKKKSFNNSGCNYQTLEKADCLPKQRRHGEDIYHLHVWISIFLILISRR